MNDVPMIAGSASTVIFVISYMPMLVKAVRTKDLSSYSPTQLVLTNFGNVLYSAYVFSLPLGPIWALHCFYLVATALMLAWYVRYSREAGRLGGARDTSVTATTWKTQPIGVISPSLAASPAA